MFYIILFLLLSYNSSQLIFPLISNNPFNNNPKNSILNKTSVDYFINNFFNDIFLKINLGSHNQELILQVSISHNPTYIVGSKAKNINSNIITYNENLSKSYKQESNSVIYETGIITGMKSKDLLTLIDINNKKYSLKFQFYLAVSKFFKDNFENVGVIGLGINNHLEVDENEMQSDIYSKDLLTQLINKKFINKKIFCFIYNKNSNKNILLIGKYPHEYDNKNFKKNEYIEADIVNFRKNDDNYKYWNLKTKAYYGDIETRVFLYNGYFDIEENFFIGSHSYKFLIKKYFFTEKIKQKICFKNIIEIKEEKYISYYCDKNVELNEKNFRDLKIENQKLNNIFIFTYQDLFSRIENFLYFNVLFINETKDDDYDEYNDWVFGKIFFNKYMVVFNLINGYRPILGFYTDSINSTNTNYFDENNKNTFGNILLMILMVIGIIIIVLLSLLLIKHYLGKRKQRANELMEDFEYLPNKFYNMNNQAKI